MTKSISVAVELLDQLAGMELDTTERSIKIQDELRAILAQPAEAEGVEVVAWAHPDYCDLITDSQIRAIEWERLGLSPVPLVRQADQLAALSAVTAERDAAQKDAERYRWVSSGLHEAETLASIVICHGGYAEKVAERVDVYREAAMAAKEPEPEHVCSGCGAKGWTGNCLECIPY